MIANTGAARSLDRITRITPNLAPASASAISGPAAAELPVLAALRHLVSIQHVCPMPESLSDRHT
jgi:hypothetical protein